MKSFRLLFILAALGVAPATMAQRSAAPIEIPDAVQPQLAAGADGRVWLVYSRPSGEPAAHGDGHHGAADHGNAKKDGKKQKGHGPKGRASDVFVAVSKDGGATFAPASKVAHVPGIMLGNRRGPRIVAHGDRITITAVAHELIAFTSDDGGATWSGPVTVNAVPNSAHEGLHDLAGSPEGELFITWLDLRNGKAELFGASSTDGGRSWGKNQLVYRSPDKSICECCHPSALFDAQGNLAVMWRNSIEGSRDMWMMTRAKGAAQFTAARKLGQGTWKINGCPHDGGTIVALGAGKFGAVWQREGEVFMIRDGSEVNLGKGKQAVAAADNQGALVVWHDGTGLVSLRDATPAKPGQPANDGRFPVLVALPGGKGAVLAYERTIQGTTAVAVKRL